MSVILPDIYRLIRMNRRFAECIRSLSSCSSPTAAHMVFSSCAQKSLTPLEGRAYNYQCYWENGPNDFSPYGEFNAAGILIHHDDTGTITGSWSNVAETVIWTLNNPPKNTSFRGTFDRKGIAVQYYRRSWREGHLSKVQ
jgi:hypothetical protein